MAGEGRGACRGCLRKGRSAVDDASRAEVGGGVPRLEREAHFRGSQGDGNRGCGAIPRCLPPPVQRAWRIEIKHGDQDMADILSGPDGTTTTHSPRPATQRPPNRGRITPISSRLRSACRTLTVVASVSRSARTVDVAAVSHAEDNDFLPLVVNPVQDAVGATSRTPYTLEFVTERCAHPPRILPKRAGDEVNDCKRDSFWECLSDRPRCWGSYNNLIGRLGHRGRNAFTASTPRTTSPSR